MASNITVYSYHTFILPFIWNDEKTKVGFGEFETVFTESGNWKLVKQKEDFNRFKYNFNEDDLEKRNDFRLFYNEYRYFYPQVSKALYYNNNIIYTFSYINKKLGTKDAKYVIKQDDKEYCLQIDAIEVKIYNTGIGLFVLKCENNTVSSIESIKNINDWGRRVVPASMTSSLTADNIIIDVPVVGPDSLAIKIENEYLSDIENDVSYHRVGLESLSGFIEDFLSDTTGKVFSSEEKNDNECHVFLDQALDDRMFVYCLICNNEYIDDKIVKPNGSERYGYQEDYDGFYELVFVDLHGRCSCQHKEMREELVESSLYKRWIDCGTLYSITSYSYIAMLSSGAEDYLFDHFKTMYYQMVCLVIAQRVSLLAFQIDLADTVNLEDTKRTEELMSLQKEYSKFEASMCFDEITPQQQGIELYQMLQDKLMIAKEMNNVKSQLDGVTSNAATYLNKNFNLIASLIAIGTILLAVLDIAAAVFRGINPFGAADRILFMSLCGAIVVAAIIALKYIMFSDHSKRS